MKGRISGIKRMEIHDGDGLRTTVFFKGCPLLCLWCHNPEGIAYESQTAFFAHRCIGCGTCHGERTAAAAETCPTDALHTYGRDYEAEELCGILLADAPFFAHGGGVTLSGGECLSQSTFAVALAALLSSRGVGVYVDTCGYAPREAFSSMLPYCEKFLYDIKAVDPTLHKRLTGRSNELILDNLLYLSESGAAIEIRYPLVVGYNDGECEAIGRLLSNLQGITRVKVLPYHNLAASRYEALGMKNTLPLQKIGRADVERAIETLRRFGLLATD